MRISSLNLDQDILKIIQNEPSSNWVKTIDNQDKSGKKLLTFLKSLIASRRDDQEICTLANQTVQKLSGRKLDDDLQKKFKKTAEKASHLGTNFLKPLDKSYIPETVAISKKAIGGDSKKEVHIYKNAIEKRYERWKKSGTSRDFDDWVKAYASDSEKKKMRKNCVKYLTETESKKYVVEFDHKKIKQNGHTVQDGDYIYVLDSKIHSLFIGKKVQGEFHHSSFTGGKPVACAGHMKLKDGKIQSINLNSGHYKPTKQQGENLITYLSDSSRLGFKAKSLTFSS